MTQEAQGKTNAAEAISFIDKAWELRWGIRLVYVALYTDVVLAWFLHRNLMSITSNSTQIWESIGALLLATAGFCLLVSLIIPAITKLITLTIIDSAPGFLINAFSEHHLREGEVSLHELRQEALRTRDDFLMAIVREEQPAMERQYIEHRRMRTMACGLVLLIIMNIWAGYTSDTQTLFVWLASGREVATYLFLGTAMVVLLIYTALKPFPRTSVYHPQLRKKKDLEPR